MTARVNPAPAPSVDSASVVEIQTRLRDRGYNIVAINGTLNSSTTAAIRAFQGDAGMPVNGVANAALLDQLRVGSSATSRTLIPPKWCACSRRSPSAAMRPAPPMA